MMRGTRKRGKSWVEAMNGSDEMRLLKWKRRRSLKNRLTTLEEQLKSVIEDYEVKIEKKKFELHAHIKEIESLKERLSIARSGAATQYDLIKEARKELEARTKELERLRPKVIALKTELAESQSKLESASKLIECHERTIKDQQILIQKFNMEELEEAGELTPKGSRILNTFNECHICCERKIEECLECGHTFCSACLDKIHEVEAFEPLQKLRKLLSCRCPFCKQVGKRIKLFF